MNLNLNAAMSMDVVLYGMLALIAIVNLVSIGLWIWLVGLVRRADEILSVRTASIYGTYLFQQVMQSRFFHRPQGVALGNPERDPVIRQVRNSNQFALIEWLASIVKEVPVNIVPFMI